MNVGETIRDFLDFPIHNLIYPLSFVRSRDLNVVVRISFHHTAFVACFKQDLSRLPRMLLGEILHLHIRKIPKNFISLMSHMYEDRGLDGQSLGVVSFGIGKYM